MRIILATNHLFSWTGSEITLSILATLLKESGHDVLVYSDFHSNIKLIEDMMPGCSYTGSLEDVRKFTPNVAYTQHHSVAVNIRSACPNVPIAHAMLGTLPHLEKFPQADLRINYFLPISEEVASTLPVGLISSASVSIFRNIVDDQLFTAEKSTNKLDSICCYSYKVSDEKYKSLNVAASERGLRIVDNRREAGSIPYKDVPQLMTVGDIVVASGRGAIEAMLCGKVPLIISDCGDDGLVTPENFETHMRTNFSGRTTAQNFNAESIGLELDRYMPSYGSQLQDLARHYFGLRARKSQIIEIFEQLAGSASASLAKDQYDNIKFLSKTYELQRRFAVDELKLRSKVSDEAPQVCEARLYVSEIVDGLPRSYTESRGAATLYPISKQRHVIRLPLPKDLKPLACIRLDLSNCPVGVLVHRLALLNADGTEAWQWDGNVQLFRNVGGLAVRETSEGLLLLCWNNDPQFELVLPPEVLASLQPNGGLLVELTPRPLLDAYAEVLIQDDRLITDLSAAANGISTVGAASVRGEALTCMPAFSKDLENAAIWLKSSLARRDQTISEQSMRLAAMRDELLRAEAQLDLLKGVMLGGREEDRL